MTGDGVNEGVAVKSTDVAKKTVIFSCEEKNIKLLYLSRFVLILYQMSQILDLLPLNFLKSWDDN